MESHGFFGTAEISEALGISQATAKRYLLMLEEVSGRPCSRSKSDARLVTSADFEALQKAFVLKDSYLSNSMRDALIVVLLGDEKGHVSDEIWERFEKPASGVARVEVGAIRGVGDDDLAELQDLVEGLLDRAVGVAQAVALDQRQAAVFVAEIRSGLDVLNRALREAASAAWEATSAAAHSRAELERDRVSNAQMLEAIEGLKFACYAVVAFLVVLLLVILFKQFR